MSNRNDRHKFNFHYHFCVTVTEHREICFLVPYLLNCFSPSTRAQFECVCDYSLSQLCSYQHTMKVRARP